ncbi:MAG: hypothetical protein U9Q98_12550 [Bacteroidota bacterium]|nr:hypothetical protein [Bacteroidota bacterium]
MGKILFYYLPIYSVSIYKLLNELNKMLKLSVMYEENSGARPQNKRIRLNLNKMVLEIFGSIELVGSRQKGKCLLPIANCFIAN